MEENKQEQDVTADVGQNGDVSAIGEMESKSVGSDSAANVLLEDSSGSNVVPNDGAATYNTSHRLVISPINDIKPETHDEPAKQPDAPSAPVEPFAPIATEDPKAPPINSLDATLSSTASVTPAAFQILQTPTPETNFNISGTLLESSPANDHGSKPVVKLIAFSVSLVLVLSIIANISALFEICFNHIGAKQSSDDIVSSYLGSYELKAIIWFCTSLVIAGIFYILLVIYLNKHKSTQFSKFGRKVYNLIYGAFMAILALFTIASFTNLVYSCFVPLVPKEQSTSLLYSAGGSAWWAGVLQALCTTIVMAFVLFYYYKKLVSKDQTDETR